MGLSSELTAEELIELEYLHRMLSADSRPQRWRYCPEEPYEKQLQFLDSDKLEAFYGGAAGGGKSSCLLMGSLEYVHVPNYAALIIRRTFQDLNRSGSILDRAKEWLDPFIGSGEVHYSREDHRFTWLKTRATLTFGYMDNEHDRRRYQGGEWQYLGFDEVTQLPELWYRYLCSRVRKKKSMTVPLRIRSAANPGDIGDEWVKRRFVDHDGSERLFVPAKARDNPFLNVEEYERSLAILDPVSRQQLEEGLWISDGGGLVYGHFSLDDVIDKDSLPKLDYHIVAHDYGFTDDVGNVVLGWRRHDPNVYIVEGYKKQKQTPEDAAVESDKLSRKYKPIQMVGDTGGLGKGYAEQAIQRFGLPIEAADKHNKRGYIALINGRFSKGKIKIVKETCRELLEEMAVLSWKDGSKKEEDPKLPNHCCDAMLYGWRATLAHFEKEPDPPKTAMQKVQDEEREAIRELENRVKNEMDFLRDLL